MVNVKPVAVATGVVAVGTTESVRSTMTDVATEVAAVDGPTPFVATTDTLMYLSMSASVRTYELFVADGMSAYEPVDEAERFH
jgi:uncharacterized Fe-S center protein